MSGLSYVRLWNDSVRIECQNNHAEGRPGRRARFSANGITHPAPLAPLATSFLLLTQHDTLGRSILFMPQRIHHDACESGLQRWRTAQRGKRYCVALPAEIPILPVSAWWGAGLCSLAQGLQHASHGYGLFWFQSFLAPATPIVVHHFWMATETRSPSIRIVFQAPQLRHDGIFLFFVWWGWAARPRAGGGGRGGRVSHDTVLNLRHTNLVGQLTGTG